jgi:formate dehydrogenase maturation protein FdhE
MDRADSEQHVNDRVQNQNDERIIFCPTCASNPDLIISMLDTCKGRTVRLFECQCGEVIWDD